jgi:radical SAM superfamily enzyme YgiQ (UPF0313 family)
MQILTPARKKERVGFLVPRWTMMPTPFVQGTPFRVLPEATALYEAGFEVVFFDEDVDLDRTDRSAELRRALAGVRMVFLWMNELDPMIQTGHAVMLARLVRSWYPRMRFTLGGAFVTNLPARMLYLDVGIEFFLRGHGQRSCVDIMAALDQPDQTERLANVSGLVFRNGSYQHNEVRTARRAPFTDTLYRMLDMTPYIQRGGIFGNDLDTLVLAMGRGCAKRCRFCYWSEHVPELASAEQTVNVVRFLHDRYGVCQFHIAELDFATQHRRIMDFARLWRDQLRGCGWFALVSPIDVARFSAEEWDLLAEGGCRKLELGTESGSADILRLIGKRHDPEDPLRIAQNLARRGIHSMHNFIFGFPGERPADRRESLRLIRKLRAVDPRRVSFTFRFYQPSYGTLLGKETLALAPDFPRELPELLANRPTFGREGHRTFDWMSPREERWIKAMCYFYLPIVTSRLVVPGRIRRALYSGLRALASLRLRVQFHRLPLDRIVYDRFLGLALDNTYTP